MELKLDSEKLTNFIEGELIALRSSPWTLSTQIPLAQWEGMQVQLVITREEEDFCDWPNKHACLDISA